ncbi:WXG100 family type VII secretion target [Amycolatopsis jiangsuensis]|uniref:ESAT-6-like protein n=1 Tax=Amycolatopsis jiangsuensis TaxID=1181879 RepID=A0A840IV74_9PSEU|nr:WXG100 family type VII secretion target [Amycolatopsis jiangsuensis]MBB4686426.1 WXG100 family type VII secretion target [Amycolatopsis jiangsuensis]
MAGGFTGTPQQFTEAEGRVVDVRAQMDQQLSKLEGEIEATRAGWQGQAQTAFDNVMRRFNDAGKGLNDALQRIGELLKEAGSTYQRSEEQQHEIVESLNKGFGVLG